MIRRSDLLTLNFYQKSPFTGSHNGKCYRIEKVTADETEQLQATIWPGPYCYDATPEDQKIVHTESFSEDGMEAVAAWLNAMSPDDKRFGV